MTTALLITSFNRPDYLKQCLESVAAADLSQVQTVLIVDDASNDPETRRLIDDFDLPGVELIKAFSKENRSIKGSLLFGFDVLFNTCNVVINLDGDAIVTKNAFNRLIELHKKYPLHISTGFNCSTKNKNGTERHIIIEQGDGVNFKRSVGGINMIFGSDTYLQIVRPALLKSQKENLNWDHQACIISYSGYDRPIACLEPSCVQHIGIDSSMGHSAGGEPPDEATDFVYSEMQKARIKLQKSLAGGASGKHIDLSAVFLDDKYNGSSVSKFEFDEIGVFGKLPPFLKKLQLPQVTLIAVDDNIEGIIKAADISCRDIEFGAVKLLSSQDSNDPRAIKIRRLGSKEAYSRFMMSDIVDYIDTPYFITIQADGWICNGPKWNNDWLEWDYIGSPWFFHTDGMQVGNGAMSLRSRRLHEILKNDDRIVPTNDHWIKEFQEDHNIARIYRPYLEKMYKIKFAPVEVAIKFGIEAWGREDKKYSGQFGFHGKGIDFSGANISDIPY